MEQMLIERFLRAYEINPNFFELHISRTLGEEPKSFFSGIPDEVIHLILQYCTLRDVSIFARTLESMRRHAETYCQLVALPQAIEKQLVEIQFVHSHPGGRNLSFVLFTAFLEALMKLPLHDLGTELNTYMKRTYAASQPRPRRYTVHGLVDNSGPHFDGGYPGGYWCDAFGLGYANDYIRRVGDHPNIHWSLCVAGSDSSQYHSWAGFSLPVFCGLQTQPFSQDLIGTEHNKTYELWQKCKEMLNQRII